MSQAASSSNPVEAQQASRPSEFLITAAPHLSATATTQSIMFQVILAMLPLFAVATYMFRLQAVLLTVVATAGALAAEAVASRMRGRSQASLADGSAVVTGMILAFSLPPSLPLYMAFIGGAVAIGLAKAVYGGLGQNLFNPAMVGRAFLMICFPVAMGTWLEPETLKLLTDVQVDGVTMATPLAAAKANQDAIMPSLFNLAIGKVGGCVGETSAIAAIIGGLYLVIRGIADWRQPVGVLGAVAIFALITGGVDGMLYHLASGALMFGAFFIATDYVGAPITGKGRLIFGVGVGVIVMVIRLYGKYPEGFMFAILVMNALTPLIERWTRPTPFGGRPAA